MSEFQLIRRAVKLFPRTDYLSAEAVRHARRQWVRSIKTLRGQNPSLWILDSNMKKADQPLVFPDLHF